MDRLPTGSWVGLAIAIDDFDRDVLAQVQQTYHAHGEALRWRSRQQALRFFDGLELENLDVVQIHKWRPELGLTRPVDDKDIAMYGGVAVKR